MKTNRWRDFEAGRIAAGLPKVTAECEEALRKAVESGPRACGDDVSNWTGRLLSLLILVAFNIAVCARTICRHLRRMGFRLIRPVLTIASPDPAYEQKARELDELKAAASRGEIILLYEDEIDINLLPGVIRCWTRRGQQIKVATPGKNRKRYGFGAVNFTTGRIDFLASEHKNSASFCDLAQCILETYKDDPRRIVLIVDNFKIHSSQITNTQIAKCKDRLSLFFLPSYSPKLNVTELLWKHLRRNVTHNHLFDTIDDAVLAVTRSITSLNADCRQVLSVIGNAIQATPQVANSA